jgi:hypothetical protein
MVDLPLRRAWRRRRPADSVRRMNSTDEVRYLEHLLNALTSGRMRLFEGDQDVTERELGRLGAEVAAIESMLQQLQSRSDDS